MKLLYSILILNTISLPNKATPKNHQNKKLKKFEHNHGKTKGILAITSTHHIKTKTFLKLMICCSHILIKPPKTKSINKTLKMSKSLCVVAPYMNKTTTKIDNLKVELPCISITTNEQKTFLTSNSHTSSCCPTHQQNHDRNIKEL